MFVLLLVIIIVFASLTALCLLSGDPWWPRLRLKVPAAPVPVLPDAIDLPMDAQEMPMSLTAKAAKVELLLLEKNKLIDRLQSDLEAERSHRQEFEKVKALLDDQILKLKEQNRALRTQREPRNA